MATETKEAREYKPGDEVKPRYPHDCNCCVFLGHLKQSDLYFHPEGNGHCDEMESVFVERWGETEGHQCATGESSYSYIIEAHRLAVSRSLLPGAADDEAAKLAIEACRAAMPLVLLIEERGTPDDLRKQAKEAADKLQSVLAVAANLIPESGRERGDEAKLAETLSELRAMVLAYQRANEEEYEPDEFIGIIGVKLADAYLASRE